jgi:hypothetical protein
MYTGYREKNPFAIAKNLYSLRLLYYADFMYA